MKKIAIVLFNLGGPSSLSEVKGFLFNLFYDPYIISLPNPFRWMLAKFISSSRFKYSQSIYAKMGGKSPILAETLAQSLALQDKLNQQNNWRFKTFVSMRYSKPFSDDTIKEIEEYQPDEIILLPLYPQFSGTTSCSSITDFLSKKNDVPIKALCCYPKEEKFIQSHVDLINQYVNKLSEESHKIILFSAHSLPVKNIEKGDPYQWQVEETVKTIMAKIGQKIDHKICYQSKVGRIPWLGPETSTEIVKAGDACLSVIMVPIAFVSEHSETLVELDIDYKKLADESGCKAYVRVPTLSLNQLFIDSLADMCIKLANEKTGANTLFLSSENNRICPTKFKGCMNNYG